MIIRERLGISNSVLQSESSNRYNSNHFHHKASTADIIMAKIATNNKNEFNLFLVFVLLNRIIQSTPAVAELKNELTQE